MARRRAQFETQQADLILPRDLVEDLPHRSREDALALWEQSRRRDEWLSERGVDKSDWTTYHALVMASRRVHGLRRRLIVADRDPTELRGRGGTA